MSTFNSQFTKNYKTIMIFGIYQSLIIHLLFVVHDVHTFSVVMRGSKVGLLGANGTEINCSYTTENITEIITVTFMAFRNSIPFEQIAIYRPDKVTSLTDQGKYLQGRVTLTNITLSSTKAVLTFNKLMCIDDTFYQCKVTYLDSSGVQNQMSNNISISVKVKPTKPDSISIVHEPVDSILTSAKHMEHSTSSPSITVTSKENETLVHNDTTAASSSTLPSIHHSSSFSKPLNEDVSSDKTYDATTYSTEQTTTTTQEIAEGDNITVVCEGDVGNPPAEFVFQKSRSGNILSMTYTATETNVTEIAENCSYYRKSSFTFQVTAKDNNASIRCVINSSMPEFDELYKETAPIEVNSDTSTLPSSSTGTSSGTGEKHGNQKMDLKPVIIGVVAAVVFLVLLGLLGYYLLTKKRKGKDESTENNGSANNLMHYSSKHGRESRPGAYDSVVLEGDAPVMSSGKKEQNVEAVRKHNEEYMKNQTNEEKNESKSPTSDQPVIYAEVNKANKSNKLKDKPDASNQQDDDTYAGTQEGIYDQSGNSRHKVDKNAEQFDKIGDVKKQNSTDDAESSLKSSQKGSYINHTLNKGEKQVATVPPISRSSVGSQGDEQTTESIAKLSQKEYENVKGTDTSDGHTINQTSL